MSPPSGTSSLSITGRRARAGRTHGAATPAPLVGEDHAGEGSGNLLDLDVRGDLDWFHGDWSAQRSGHLQASKAAAARQSVSAAWRHRSTSSASKDAVATSTWCTKSRYICSSLVGCSSSAS